MNPEQTRQVFPSVLSPRVAISDYITEYTYIIMYVYSVTEMYYNKH